MIQYERIIALEVIFVLIESEADTKGMTYTIIYFH